MGEATRHYLFLFAGRFLLPIAAYVRAFVRSCHKNTISELPAYREAPNYSSLE